MKILFLAISMLSTAAFAAPCQVRLDLLSQEIRVVNNPALDVDGTLAREALTETIDQIIDASKEAGLELVEDAGDNVLQLDLRSIRKDGKLKGTAIEVKLHYESKLGGVSSLSFGREASLPLFGGAKAQPKELAKRVKEALKDIRKIPGCR